MNFPRFVYKAGGKYQRLGGTYSFITVNSETELNEHISNGWHFSLNDLNSSSVKKTEDIDIKTFDVKVPADNEPVTRDELLQKAKELGINIHHKMKDSTIESMINDFLSKQGK